MDLDNNTKKENPNICIECKIVTNDGCYYRSKKYNSMQFICRGCLCAEQVPIYVDKQYSSIFFAQKYAPDNQPLADFAERLNEKVKEKGYKNFGHFEKK